MTKKAETPKVAKAEADASKPARKARAKPTFKTPPASAPTTVATHPASTTSPTPAASAAIGKIDAAPSDAGSLEQAPTAHSAPTPSKPNVPAVPAAPEAPKSPQPTPPPPHDESLELPKGAFIALRKSGGLQFSSIEIVLYPDGRITFGGGDNARASFERGARRLLDVQIVRMRRTLETSGFFRMKSASGHQPPDSYAYELAARVGTQFNRIEFFTGGIPSSLAGLVEQLTNLLPSD